MRHHRFREPLAPSFLFRPQRPALAPGAFLLCPACWGGPVGVITPWQQQLYQAALMQAQAVHQPSLPERLHSVTTN
jgi:hypothetical protein